MVFWCCAFASPRFPAGPLRRALSRSGHVGGSLHPARPKHGLYTQAHLLTRAPRPRQHPPAVAVLGLPHGCKTRSRSLRAARLEETTKRVRRFARKACTSRAGSRAGRGRESGSRMSWTAMSRSSGCWWKESRWARRVAALEKRDRALGRADGRCVFTGSGREWTPGLHEPQRLIRLTDTIQRRAYPHIGKRWASVLSAQPRYEHAIVIPRLSGPIAEYSVLQDRLLSQDARARQAPTGPAHRAWGRPRSWNGSRDPDLAICPQQPQACSQTALGDQPPRCTTFWAQAIRFRSVLEQSCNNIYLISSNRGSVRHTVGIHILCTTHIDARETIARRLLRDDLECLFGVRY